MYRYERDVKGPKGAWQAHTRETWNIHEKDGIKDIGMKKAWRGYETDVAGARQGRDGYMIGA